MGAEGTLLDCSADEGVRRLVVQWIDDSITAADRTADANDTEALHDMRVALRKLRTALRTYRGVLRGAVKRKRLTRLRDLVRQTGEGRDAEVQLAWIESVAPQLEAEAHPGARWHRERLLERKERGYRRLREETVPALRELLPKLRENVSSYMVERRVFERPDHETFGQILGQRLREQIEDLVIMLRRVRSIEDEELAHEARISGKRLRYLLEPVRDEAKSSLKTLKSLQDSLGELNDIAVRTAVMRDEIERAALERARLLTYAVTQESEVEFADTEQGLFAMMRLSHQRKVELFDELQRGWIAHGSRLDELAGEIEVLARELDTEPLPQEIERKYLLRALPEQTKDASVQLLEQGYLPGEQLRERLRRVTENGVQSWFRSVKLGRGLARIEIEEETTREVFTKLWALTRGRRVKKRRYRIEDNGHVWEIDEFLDRSLFLAEVELDSLEDRAEVPDWLSPFVIREVTEESGFVNANLAK